MPDSTYLTPQTDEQQRIWTAIRQGELSPEAGERLLAELVGADLAKAWTADAMEARSRDLGIAVTTPASRDILKTQEEQNKFERETDPFTAYRNQLGLGGKTTYNPAEQYQMGQFNPLMNLFNTSRRLYDPAEGPLAGKTVAPSTFTDYYNSARTAGRGAVDILKDIFGATAAQKTGVGEAGLGYEPTRFDPDLISAEQAASGGLNEGNLEELQRLLRLGVGQNRGAMSGIYASRRLPMAQQSYYEQQKAGTAGSDNFLDWLNKRWQLGY